MEHTRVTLEEVFGPDLHLARIRSLAGGVTGVLNARTASVAALGRAYATARGIETKSGIKQIDRLLSNEEGATRRVVAVVGSSRRRLDTEHRRGHRLNSLR